MITTVFFDWGGVVATDPGDDFLEGLFKSVGATDEQVPEIFRTYLSKLTRGTIKEADFWNELRSVYHLNIPETISAEFAHWKGLVANEQILAYLTKLRQDGYKLGLISNMIEPSCRILEQTPFFDYFDETIISYEVGYGKPHKEIFEIALKKLDAQPDEAIFIDDKQAFLNPAIEMGFYTVLATSPEQIIADTSKLLTETH